MADSKELIRLPDSDRRAHDPWQSTDGWKLTHLKAFALP